MMITQAFRDDFGEIIDVGHVRLQAVSFGLDGIDKIDGIDGGPC